MNGKDFGKRYDCISFFFFFLMVKKKKKRDAVIEHGGRGWYTVSWELGGATYDIKREKKKEGASVKGEDRRKQLARV